MQWLWSSNLITHQTIHSRERPYVSDWCEKTFCLSRDPTKHQGAHTAEKPYKSSETSFCQKSNLPTHQCVHTGEGPYNCARCDKALCLDRGVSADQGDHAAEKPHICHTCETAFSQSLSLIISIHTRERPFTQGVSARETSVLRGTSPST